MGYLLCMCESWGAWPTLTSHVHIILLAKPTGGHRPIALLTSLYRVWGRARLDWVRRWAGQLGRSYLALVTQKSTTDVAARLLVQSEATSVEEADADVSMHAIVGIEKCFDRAPWRALAKAFRDHGFPARLFILALRMYIAPRRLAWAGCHVVPIWASQGVLPGCPFAMFCLQCVMLTPFDELVNSTEYISRSLDIYADDITIAITGPASHIVSAAC
eukprot:1151147-Pyramimonas_sp.AAC.1